MTAKQSRASRFFTSLMIFGWLLLLVGLVLRNSFMEGLGIGLGVVMGFALVVLKRKN